MKPKSLYLVLCAPGLLLPYWQFLPWLSQHRLSFATFFTDLFANRISAFFATDVIVSAIVLIVFMRVESARSGIRKRWLPVLALVTVGVSLALPLFLYLREVELEQGGRIAKSPAS